MGHSLPMGKNIVVVFVVILTYSLYRPTTKRARSSPLPLFYWIILRFPAKSGHSKQPRHPLRHLSYPRPPLPSSRSTQLSPLQSVDAVRPSRPSTIKSLLQFSFFSWPRQGRHRHAHIGSRARPPTLFCLSSVDPPWPLDPDPQSAPQAICFCRLCLPCLALPRSPYHVYPVYTGAFSAFLRSIFPPPSCHYTTVECLYSGYRTHRSRQIRSLI